MAEEDKKEGLEPQDEPEKDSGDVSGSVKQEQSDAPVEKVGDEEKGEEELEGKLGGLNANINGHN